MNSQAMDHVARFVSEVADILGRSPEREQLSQAVTRKLAALIGRVGVTDTGFAAAQDVANAVREARARISQHIAGDEPNKHLVFLEIDKTLAIVSKNAKLPQTLA